MYVVFLFVIFLFNRHQHIFAEISIRPPHLNLMFRPINNNNNNTTTTTTTTTNNNNNNDNK